MKIEINNRVFPIFSFNKYFSIFLFILFSSEFLFNNGKCPDGQPYKKSGICTNTCNNQELFDNKKCIPISLVKEDIASMIDIIENYYISQFTNINNEIIINGEGIIYQITTNNLIENQNDIINSIHLNLGKQCIDNIKKLNKDLLFILINIINSNYTTSIEGFKIIVKTSKEKIPLNQICGGEAINLGIPVLVQRETLTKYKELKENYNYDILNLNNSFYTDICQTYTTEDKTDISLSKRKEIYGSHGIDICSKNCIYKKFDINLQKIYCECYIDKGDEDNEEKKN